MTQWRQCSDLAPPSPVVQPSAADSSVQASGLSGRTKRLLRGMGSLVSRSSLHHTDEDAAALRSSGEWLGAALCSAAGVSGRAVGCTSLRSSGVAQCTALMAHPRGVMAVRMIHNASVLPLCSVGDRGRHVVPGRPSAAQQHGVVS